MFKANFGKYLRSSRRRKDVTQKQLATACDTTQHMISRFETGLSEPRLETFLLIADELDFELEDLLQEVVGVNG